jgi:hypothetical protein
VSQHRLHLDQLGVLALRHVQLRQPVSRVTSGPIYASLCWRIAVWSFSPGPGEVPATAVPHLARLDTSPGLATVLAPGRPVRRATLCVATTLYEGLRPAALFDALGSQLKELVLLPAPDVDARTRGWLLGVLAKTASGLEVLELRLEGKSDKVRRGATLASFVVPDRGVDLTPCSGVCVVSRCRSRCRRYISRLARCCPACAHSARFVCAPCGLLRLPNRRKAPHGWRYDATA